LLIPPPLHLSLVPFTYPSPLHLIPPPLPTIHEEKGRREVGGGQYIHSYRSCLQVELVEQLCVVATAVKTSRDAHRQTTLVQELKKVVDKFIGQFRLPLNPSLLVKGIDVEVSPYYV
jgi:hypothetical protein